MDVNMMNKKMSIKEMYKEYENDPEFMKGLMVTNFLSEVYEIMENNHIKKSELAKRMNVSRQYITKLFTGYANFTLMTLAQISIALNLDINIKLSNKERRKI
jgi:plasmid maintenance system antidote protein VapI